MLTDAKVRLDVSIRQHTSAYVSICQQTSADVSRRQQTSADVSVPCVSIRQHVFLRGLIRVDVDAKVQHTSACVPYVSMRQHAYLRDLIRVDVDAKVRLQLKTRGAHMIG
jgi:hypothetical protein